MFNMYTPNGTSSVNLQATIASATSGSSLEGEPACLPHHPISCASGGLYFDEEGDLSCDHAKASHGDRRTQAALTHSIAILIVELGCAL